MHKEGIYAGIDCGTVSLRLFVAHVFPDGSYKKLMSVSVDHGLASDLRTQNILTPPTLETLKQKSFELIQCAKKYGAVRILGAATGSLRGADNGVEALRELNKTGIPYRIIDGEEEMRVSFRGAAPFLSNLGPSYYFIDSGGSSTEIILAQGKKAELIHGKSFDVGFKHIARQLGEDLQKPTPQTVAALVVQTADLFRKEVQTWPQQKIKKVAITVPQLMRFYHRHADEDLSLYEGRTLCKEDVKSLLADLLELGFEGRSKEPSIDARGVEYIPAATLKTLALMDALGVEEVYIAPTCGVSAGLALMAASQAFEEK